MAFSMLPSLRPGDWRAVICVRVVRKWAYRGGTDDGPIQHVDLVLVDQQGNSLYGEIPGSEVEAKSPDIDEDGIYVIARFRVSNAKSAFRAVDAPFMVEFTLHTTVTAPTTNVAAFPRYAYKITPIDGLAAYAGDTKNFLDTIGTLVEVSGIQTVQLPNKPAPTASRHIVLRDLSYSELKITLWGQKATEFTTEGVYNRNEAKPIVVLFVGGLMKSFQRNYYLSGNAACRWYFNPQIPEEHPFYASFQNQRLEIRAVAPTVQQNVEPRVPAQLEEKNLLELNLMDPYKFAEKGYRCTVTVGELLPGASWWFPSCNKCSKSCVPEGGAYRCIPCSSSSFKFKYKVCFLALDGTDEAEMIAFGDVARRIIGKPVQQLIRTSAGPNVYPPEITRLVSLRFTFAVTMSRQSYYKAKKTYNVAALVTAHGQPVAVPVDAPHDDDAGQVAPHDDDAGQAAAGSGGSSDNSVDSEDAAPDPDVLNTPQSSLPSLETPPTKKHQRSGSSKDGKHSSSRRKLILDDDETADAAIQNHDPSGKAIAAQVRDSSGEESSSEKND